MAHILNTDITGLNANTSGNSRHDAGSTEGRGDAFRKTLGDSAHKAEKSGDTEKSARKETAETENAGKKPARGETSGGHATRGDSAKAGSEAANQPEIIPAHLQTEARSKTVPRSETTDGLVAGRDTTAQAAVSAGKTQAKAVQRADLAEKPAETAPHQTGKQTDGKAAAIAQEGKTAAAARPDTSDTPGLSGKGAEQATQTDRTAQTAAVQARQSAVESRQPAIEKRPSEAGLQNAVRADTATVSQTAKATTLRQGSKSDDSGHQVLRNAHAGDTVRTSDIPDMPHASDGVELKLTGKTGDKAAFLSTGPTDITSSLPAGETSASSERALNSMAAAAPSAPAPAAAQNAQAIAPHLAAMRPQAAMAATPAEVVDIIQSKLNGSDGTDRLVVQLDPPELGRLSIDFRFDAQGLQHITVTGETPEALKQLRQLHFHLTQALEQHGLSGEDMTFQQQFAGQDGQAGNFAGLTGHPDGGDEEAVQPVMPAIAGRQLSTTLPAGLDIKV